MSESKSRFKIGDIVECSPNSQYEILAVSIDFEGRYTYNLKCLKNNRMYKNEYLSDKYKLSKIRKKHNHRLTSIFK